MSTNRPSTSDYAAQQQGNNGAQSANWQPPDQKKSARRSPYLWGGILLALLVIIGGSIAAFLKLNQTPTKTPVQSTIVGHAFFVNSGQISISSNVGIADQMQISLQNIPPPTTGKSYYVWLLSDSKTQALPLLLGTLPVQNGEATLTYPGDSHHTDILASYSRFLVTEEDANTPPVNYTLDKSAWIFGAAFSEQPNPLDTLDHFSLLNHLRHLLAQDPKLKAAGLVGGLDIWLFRNTQKLLEWAGSAKDSNDTAFKQRQLVRMLDYLDGSQFVRTEHLPAGFAAIEVDPTIARVGLLEIDPTQTPPGYLKHIGNHLREITQSPGVTADQKALAVRITSAIDNVQFWLENAHKDIETLLQMPPAQLLQPTATKIFDDMFTQTNTAFIGQTDPNTLQVKEGVAQIHYNIQRLATFVIQQCTAKDVTCG
jgi:eukaryotic-like serine/threonine-protein kinase